MSTLPRWSLVAASLVVTLAVVGLIGFGWKGRADDICRKEAPATGSGYTIQWKWEEFAYVCDYQAPAKPPRRVGVLDAFHSGGRERHGP
jgi:hypothetical protein